MSYPLSRTYRKWSSMIQRCTNPKHIAYAYYGGSGVVVCDLWRNSFQAFQDDLGEAPDGMWLDRIDNTKGYEPGNCRWVTPSDSAKNRRPRAINPGSLAGRCRLAGLKYSRVYDRIRRGWTEAEAMV